MLQARLHIRILQQYNRTTKITTLGREQVFREHIYPVNIIHALIHSLMFYDYKRYFGSGHDVSPSIETLMKSNGPTLQLASAWSVFYIYTITCNCTRRLFFSLSMTRICKLTFLVNTVVIWGTICKGKPGDIHQYKQNCKHLHHSVRNTYLTFVTGNLSVKKCTLFYRWVQRTISQSSLLFFEHPVSDQHVVLAHTTQQAHSPCGERHTSGRRKPRHKQSRRQGPLLEPPTGILNNYYLLSAATAICCYELKLQAQAQNFHLCINIGYWPVRAIRWPLYARDDMTEFWCAMNSGDLWRLLMWLKSENCEMLINEILTNIVSIKSSEGFL